MAIRVGDAVFLHVPRTGGTFLRTVLVDHFRGEVLGDMTEDDHNDRILAERFIQDGKRCLFFCFVRHPLRWIYSTWAYWTENSPTIRDQGKARKKRTGKFRKYTEELHEIIVEGDINRTLRNLVELHPGYVSRTFEGFAKGCDRIGKYERLHDEFFEIMEAFGIPISDAMRENIRGRERIQFTTTMILPDKDLTEEVLKTEREAMERFEYGEI